MSAPPVNEEPCEYCVPQPPPNRYTSRSFQPAGSHVAALPGVGSSDQIVKMPRSITPCSVRMTNGTVAPPTVVVAASAGIVAGSVSGRTDPSCALYDHVVTVGASQSASVAAPRPAASVVQTHGVMCGPENIGPFFEWFVTTRRTVSSPDFASMVLSPSSRPVTRPRRTSPFAVKSSLTSVPSTVTTASAAASPESDTSTSPSLTYAARVDVVSSTSAPSAAFATVRAPTSSGLPSAFADELLAPPASESESSEDELHALATRSSAAAPARQRSRARDRVTDRRAPSRSPRTPRGRLG